MNIKTIVVIFIALMMLISVQGSVSAAKWQAEQLLSRYLETEYPWEEIHVTNARIYGNAPDEFPKDIYVEKGPLGNAVFAFIFSDGRKVSVKAHVKAFAKVVKSKRPFMKGHSISDDDIYISKMEVKKIPKGSVRDSADINGKTLRRSVAANVPIVEKMIERSKPVKRGKMVMIVVKEGVLNIKLPGKLKKNSYVGMYVTVINLTSKKEVTGLLVDENTVEVSL